MKTKTSLDKEAATHPWSLACSSLCLCPSEVGNHLPWFSHSFTRQRRTTASSARQKWKGSSRNRGAGAPGPSWPAGLCPPWPAQKREQRERRLSEAKAALCRGLWAGLVLNSPIGEISKSLQEPETSVHPVSFHSSLQEKVPPMRFPLLLSICAPNTC